MNQFIMLASQAEQEISERTQQISSFFTTQNLGKMFDQLCTWSISLVGKIVIAIIIWLIGKKIISIVIKMLKKLLDKGTLDAGVNHFICSALRFVLYAVLILIVVGQLGFETTSLLTLFGSAALAVGMSLQGSLSNFAGGLLILIFKPFQVGDYIISNNMEGSVVAIELLYTRLHTVDNKIILLPNGALANSSITNVGSENERRLDITVGVSYTADLKTAKNTLVDVLNGYPAVIKDKEIKVIVKSLDESCVTIESRVWVKQEDYWNTRFDLLELYKEKLEDNGVEIPFNQLDVHISNLQ